MAELNGLCASELGIKNRFSDYYNSVNCPGCSELKLLLKEAYLEISSLQYINKLLYKELHNETSTNTGSEWTRMGSRSHIPSSNGFNKAQGNPGTPQTLEPVHTTNRYSLLAYPQDPAVNSIPFDSVDTRGRNNHYHTYYGKQHRNTKNVSNYFNKQYGRTPRHQPTRGQKL